METIENKLQKINKDNLFNEDQIHEIRLGLQESIDVSAYAKSEFNSLQMEEIRFGLQDNVDVSVYAKSEFDWRQMQQIRLGLEANVDVSAYAKSELDWEQMKQIRIDLLSHTWGQERKLENKLELELDLAGAHSQHRILDELWSRDLRFSTEEDLRSELGDFGVPKTNYVLHRTFELGYHFPKLLTEYLSGGAKKTDTGRLTLLGQQITADYLQELHGGNAV